VLSARELRRLEPWAPIGPTVRGGLSVPATSGGPGCLLPRCAPPRLRAGAEFVHAEARRVAGDGMELATGGGGRRCVLVAAGAHSAALHPGLAGLVRPVKGEILRLRTGPAALPHRAGRARVVDGRPVYAVLGTAEAW